MFDNISFISVLTPLAVATPFVALAVFFLPVYCSKKTKGIGEGDMTIRESFLASLAGAVVITLIGIMTSTGGYYSANTNAQTLNALQLEATDLNLLLKGYIIDILEKAPSQEDIDEKWSSLGTYSFLAEPPTRNFHKIRFLTAEEFKVTQQYIRHCYSSEAGDAAREYMSTYPVEPEVVSKKLVKAQSITSDADIQKDCLNTASLTFLK